VSAFNFTPSSTAESDAESDPEGETDDDASSGPCLVHARAAPAWIISPHILHGYRVRHTSADALRSLFRLHNETCSVWSHLLGLFFFAALGLWRWPQLEYAPAYLRLCFAGFYVCVCVCMGCSAGYHLFNCVDLDVYRWAYAIDMTGIVFCILAQYAGALTLAFACFPTLQIVYLVVCFTLASVALISQHHSSCRFPMPMWRRVIPLITFAGSVVVPFAHWGLITTQFQLTMLALPMLAAFCLYCIGLAFWLTAMPERLIPGVLDRFLTSHGLWHICVVAAAATFERGLFATVELVVNGSWCQGIS
jgi:adiponectin receptor